jgi:hypothetical protein
MLNAITTRTSTPQEDAEPWPGGSARPVLDHLTRTLGMTGACARELLKAARTAQAEGGPGTLADYPLPGGGAHLLFHYAPGSRAYRLKLTTLQDEAPPGTGPQPGTALGNDPGPDGPPRGRETPDASPPGHGDGTPAPGLPAPPGGAAQPGPGKITVTIWHNVAHDAEGRHTAMLDGYQPADPMVRVFAYQADPAGRTPEQVAEEAFATFNDHPLDPDGADLACAYYGRRLRSLSFPGNSPCCSRSCCLHRGAMFGEADARDPGHLRTWVVLVDGAEHRLDLIRVEAARRGVTVRIYLAALPAPLGPVVTAPG